MRYSIVIISFLASIPVSGQFRTSLSVGYGTYRMSNLKAFQKELLADFPEDSRITEDFPGYLYYDLTIAQPLSDQLRMGISATYGSTGGRLSYKDYSGEVTGNQLVRYLGVGVPFKLSVYDNPDKELSLNLVLTPQVSMNWLTLEFYSRLNNQSDESRYKFRSLNFAIEPGISATKSFGLWEIDFFGGYNVNVVKGNLFFTKNEEAYLQDANGDPVKIDLSGLRFSLGVAYIFDF